MNLKFISFTILNLLLATGVALSQQLQITVIDATTQTPVPHVTYKYGTAKGQSDHGGKINILFRKDVALVLTHISFNEVRFTASEVQALSGKHVLLEPAAQHLNPVLVVGVKGKLPQKLRKLENADWVQHDAGQVLQKLPGFSAIRKSGAYGFDPVFRGMKQEQLNILNDGALGAYAACPNRMDPPTSQVMINQVEQIEVMKGPHSFRYGPAMGAVINFKSAAPVFTEKTTFFGRVNAGFESNGSIYRTEGMAGIRTAKLQLSAAGSYSRGNSYRDGNDTLIPARFNRGAAGLYLHYQPKTHQLLSVSATRNFTKNTSFPTLMMDLLSDDTWMLQASYKISSKTKWYDQWETQVSSSFVDHTMGNGLRPASASMLSFVRAATQTSSGRTEFTIRHKGGVLYTGADLKYEAADGNRTRKMITGSMAGKLFTDTLWQDARQWRAGIFADWYVQAGDYKLSFSGRADRVQARAGTIASTFTKLYGTAAATDVNASFSAGISRRFSPQWYVGAWLGRGVRSASLTERFINSLPVGLDPYEVVGNPLLKPEANLQSDVTLAWQHTGTSIELNAYTSWVSDYITAVINPALKPRIASAPGVRQFVNISRALLYGFELNWSQQWIPQFRQQVTVVYTRGENRKTGSPLPEIAPLDVRFKLEAPLHAGKWQPYTLVRYVAAQNRVAYDFGERMTKSFTTVDIGAKWQPFSNIQASVAVNNLFNKAYREHLSRYINGTQPLNAPGRSLVLMVVYQF